MTGADVLQRHAREVWVALGRLQSTTPVGLQDLLADPAVLELHERFVADASSIDDDLRARVLAAAGERAEAVLDVVYADDLLPRVITMLDDRFGLGVWPTYQDVETADLGPAVAELVAALDAVDLLDAETRDAITARVAVVARTPLTPPDTSVSPRLLAALALADAYVRNPFDNVGALSELVGQQLDEAAVVGVVLAAARAGRVRAETLAP